MSAPAPLQNLAAKPQPLSSSTYAGLQRNSACCSPTGSLASESSERKTAKRLQAKLTVGASNDPLEREADRIADRVLAEPSGSVSSGASRYIQRFTAQPSAPASVAPASVDQVLASPGRPLDPALRQDMEQRFGHDFSRVRVHSGGAAEQSAQELRANAYTIGHDIVFASGRFAPGSHEGRRLIAHELTHVVQQSGAVGGSVGQGNKRRGLPPISRADVALARDVDAGAPPDAGASGGPRDAGPIAGAPAPSPVPAPAPAGTPRPTPAAVAPTATIGAVKFRGSDNRIAPTRTTTVPVTLTGLPAGGSATIDVEGSGALNGTATVTAGSTLASSGTVTVRGDAQTAPTNAGKLRLRATVGGKVAGRSPGFTVAAYPISFTNTYLSDINDGTLLGMVVEDSWLSDGSGAINELDQVDISERVDMQSRDNPPFTVPGATSATAGTSGYEPANSLTTDRFQMAKTSINTTGLVVGAWTRVQGQLSLFRCKRTGVTDVVMPDSGFKIIQMVYNFNPFAPSFRHVTINPPAAITVEGRTATAGAGGTATSPEHIL